MIRRRLIEELKQDEGFRSKPYTCTAGVKTIGYGTTYPITKTEIRMIGGKFDDYLSESQAEILLVHRLEQKIKELNLKLEWLKNKPHLVQDILYNMAYQMGVKGVLGFKNTLAMIKRGEYQDASRGMLYSLWAKQTPNRAKRLSDKMATVWGN